MVGRALERQKDKVLQDRYWAGLADRFGTLALPGGRWLVDWIREMCMI